MNENLQRIINHPASIPAVVGVVAFSAGVGLGHILWNRKKGELHVLPKDMGLDPLDDIEEEPHTPVVIDRDVYEDLANDGINEDTLEEALLEVAREEQEPEPEVVTHNVFAGNDEEWDYETEIQARTEDRPYILHKDEFYENEKGYTQRSLTYYSGDEILADDDDKPVYNIGQIVGELKFGHGSGDPQTVYIRNDKLRAEYEIINYDGHFAVEVLGHEIEATEEARELRHSSDQRFRTDD